MRGDGRHFFVPVEPVSKKLHRIDTTGQSLPDQSRTQCRACAPARHRRERAAGPLRLPAADRRELSSAGLQSVRNLLPDNTVQTAGLKPWVIGVTVTQTCSTAFAPPTACGPPSCRCNQAVRRCAMSARACCSTLSPPTPTCSPTSRWSRRSAPTSPSCARRSASPSAASTPAT